jgi:putative membrane protein
MNKLFLATAATIGSVIFGAMAHADGPNDAQIAAIVVTANQVDINAGELAKSKTKNEEVKAFAQRMVTDHTGVNKSAVDLVTKLKVKPEQNDTTGAWPRAAPIRSKNSRASLEKPLTRLTSITR